MAAPVGLEPTASRLTAACSAIEALGQCASPPGRFRSDDLLFFKQALLPTELPGGKARTEGLEPPLFGFVDRCVHPVTPRSHKAERTGFEPATGINYPLPLSRRMLLTTQPPLRNGSGWNCSLLPGGYQQY